MVTAAEIEDDHGIPADHITTVSSISAVIEDRFRTPELDAVHVLGELSNHSRWKGNDFFTLKDGDDQLSCVRFSDGVELHEGDEVLVRGSIDYYREKGRASLKATKVIPVGTGELYGKLQELKQELREDGVFDGGDEPPKLPETVGLVTSPEADARSDFLEAFRVQNPAAEIRSRPASVQGDDAVEELLAAIDDLDGTVDTIALVRGGGDIEDLRAFNDEALGRQIAATETPVITGVGHREDETVAGLAADVWAMTPTDAGRKASTRLSDVQDQLQEHRQQLQEQLAARERFHEQQREIERRQRRERALAAVIIALTLAIVAGVVL